MGRIGSPVTFETDQGILKFLKSIRNGRHCGAEGVIKMDRNEVIRLIQKHYSVLLDEYGVSRIGIFGSLVKGPLREDSDLDIVVEFKEPIGFKFNRLVEYLENLFGRKVNVLTKEGIKNIRIKEIARNIERTLVYV